MAIPALTSPPETAVIKPHQPGFRYWHETVLVALLVGVLLYAAKTDPSFLKMSSQMDALSNIWQTALIAVPMTLIIITGGIDGRGHSSKEVRSDTYSSQWTGA